MHQEHECKFVLMAWVLASAEVGFVAWIGPKLLRGVEGFAYFHLHFWLLWRGGNLGGGGLGNGGLGGGLPLVGGGGGEGRRVRGLGGGGGWGRLAGGRGGE